MMSGASAPSGRRAVQPLMLAIILVASIAAALHRFVTLSEREESGLFMAVIGRSVRDPYCISMLALAAALLLCALFQSLAFSAGSRRAWVGFLAGLPAHPQQTRMDAHEAAAQQLFIIIAPLQFGIWALPLLGFIGTVLGITTAIGGLDGMLSNPGSASAESIGAVMQGLRFAFDTTFVGLVLVIPLMVALISLRAAAQRGLAEEIVT